MFFFSFFSINNRTPDLGSSSPCPSHVSDHLLLLQESAQNPASFIQRKDIPAQRCPSQPRPVKSSAPRRHGHNHSRSLIICRLFCSVHLQPHQLSDTANNRSQRVSNQNQVKKSRLGLADHSLFHFHFLYTHLPVSQKPKWMFSGCGTL